MIFDNLYNQSHYGELAKYLEWAVKRMESPFLIGREELQDGAFALLVKNENIESTSLYESHTRYIDLHIIVEGFERFSYTPTQQLELVEVYNEENDCAMYEGVPSGICDLQPGMFIVFYPGEGHIPNQIVKNDMRKVTKIIIKIPISI